MRRERLFSKRHARRGGFTLAEVLVAITVVGVAITIGISLFNSGRNLERGNRSARLAAEFAREQMTEIRNHPNRYVWHDFEEMESGQTYILVLAEDESASTFEVGLPAVSTADYAPDKNAEKDFQSRFTWNAYCKKPDSASSHYELIVVVRWEDPNNMDERGRRLALTTSIPRYAVKEAS